MYVKKNLALAMVVALMPFEIWAQPEPIDLPRIEHGADELRVEDPAGTLTTYTPETLEALPTYRLETTTPWRDEPAVFDGVRLTDVLQTHGLDGVDAIRVIAENEFVTVIEADTWRTDAFLIATRINGEPIGRRDRGPFLFVVDADTFNSSDLITEGHLVWFAATIEVAD